MDLKKKLFRLISPVSGLKILQVEAFQPEKIRITQTTNVTKDRGETSQETFKYNGLIDRVTGKTSDKTNTSKWAVEVMPLVHKSTPQLDTTNTSI